MASDERDRNFDKALGRHLRSVAPAQQAANATARPALSGSACPDSEMLAAYHERSLLPEELNACKEHIVGCQKCQMILAHLEETDAIPLPSAQQEQVPAESEWARAAAMASHAASPIAVSARRAEEKSVENISRAQASRRPQLLRGASWRWLAPAGAVAAGLLIWIAARENPRLLRQSSEETKIAKNIPASAPPVPASSLPASPALTAPQSTGAASKAQAAPNEVASTYSRAESYGMEKKQAHGIVPSLKAAEEPATADKESRLRKDGTREAGDLVGGAVSSRDLDAKTVSGAAKGTAELQAKAPPPAPLDAQSAAQAQLQDQLAAASQIQNQVQNQAQNQANANMQRVPGPAPLGQAAEPRHAKAAPAAPAHSASAGSSAALSSRSSAPMALKMVSSAGLILVPGSSVVWRPGPGGLIEISNDGGASWSRQTSGVSAELVAGFAVSDKICWVVGRAGTVLLTVDGGAHWRIVNSPLSEDLGGVRATDALHATVWNLQRTKSFETSDGGVTWQPIANP